MLSGPNLLALDLSNNKLEGPIPAITSIKLFRLRLGSNFLNGTIPSNSLWSDLGLMYLELDDNSLSGEIPSELGMLKKLALLNLAQNRLTGRLPSSLGNLSNLQVLSLQFNNFVGHIPLQILEMSNLEKLNLSKNSMNGCIPLEISKLQKIRDLDLQGNNLHGSISESIGNLNYLMELLLGSNQLSGRIPAMPESLQIALNLSCNLFSGEIPSTLSRLPNLEVLDLSNNRFTGEIPNFQANSGSLTHLLLMNNNLSGVVPRFWHDVLVDTRGNKNLIDTTKNRSPPLPHRHKKSIRSDFLIAAAGAMPIGLLISVIAIFISRRYDSVHGTLSNPNTIHSPVINFKKAMAAASDPSNIILKSRFSTFYKVSIPSGTTYLVKKFKHTNKIFQYPRYKELMEELGVLGKLSNSNIMIPVAYILTVRRAYVFYEFTLRRSTSLDWASRFNIAVGVSKGLAFLHKCSSSPIILLDLCSKSILLKSMDEPQISDIELCNLIHPSNLFFAGSVGYSPPEYVSTKRVTAAGNVYSFGVVLLELVTGKPAVSKGSELVKWVLSISEEGNRWDEILDWSVSETSVGVRNQMLAVAEVALACISISPEMRPNSVTVLQMLLSLQ